MFGIWRTLLAVEVVAFHLMFLPFIGAYAVFSFFVLSGFLMTAIMQGTYGYSRAGFVRYLTNRGLRLYPCYWFAIAITLALIAVLGQPAVSSYHPTIVVPATLGDWLQNLTMIFVNIVPRDEVPRLVPLAWALTVEIVYYVLIGLGLSRTRAMTWFWLAISIAYVVGAQGLTHPRDLAGEIVPIYQYSAIPAGSLPFACGALVWHYRDDLRDALLRVGLGDARLIIAARWFMYFAVAMLFASTGWKPLVMIGNWVNILLSALIICSLFATQPTPRLRKIDKVVGDFSYPIYLLHLQMGLVAALLLFGRPITERSSESAAVFALGLLLTLIIGAVSARLLDPAVERLRMRIKRRSIVEG